MMSEKQDSEDDPGHAGGDSLVVKTEGLAEKFLRIDSTEQNRSGQNNEPDPDQTEKDFLHFHHGRHVVQNIDVLCALVSNKVLGADSLMNGH